jgi:hypothetical protein
MKVDPKDVALLFGFALTVTGSGLYSFRIGLVVAGILLIAYAIATAGASKT